MTFKKKPDDEPSSCELSHRLLKEYEVAEILNVSVKSLQNWRWRGLPPAFVRINGAVRYRREDITALMERSDAE